MGELTGLGTAELSAYLTEHSGLPGPRANLGLADEFAGQASSAQIRELAASGDEYLALCGAIGLGDLLVRGESAVEELHRLAGDARWRVREGVARGLQRLGDAAPEKLVAIVAAWAADPDPLVQRAAIAAICEPRLLKNPTIASAALKACQVTTDSLIERVDRRIDGVRVLRQALGYCWSVAVAADPNAGLPAFARLRELGDVDAEWIVRENLTKARLQKVL